MSGVIDVAGLSVNVLTEKEMTSFMKILLSNDYMNIVYMISVDTCAYVYDKPDQIDLLNGADLLLPAEKIILSKRYRHTVRGVVRSYKNFFYVLRNKKFVKSIFVIGQTEKETEQLVEILHGLNEKLNICGTYSVDQEQDHETVINEINEKVPDIIITALDIAGTQEWLSANRYKFNAKLCVALCDVSETIIKENISPPKWIVSLYLEKLYYKIIRKKYTENKKKERTFRALLADYKETKTPSA